MTINFENEQEDAIDLDPESVAKQVIIQSLDDNNCPYDVDVNVMLVDEETIQSINKSYRKIDAVTDVLSFPLIEYKEAGIFDEEELLAQDAFHPDSGELMLGDIVICIPRMKQQAIEYGHDQKREFAFLVAHSMLHLFGYDHMTETEAFVMEQKQRAVLDKLNIKR